MADDNHNETQLNVRDTPGKSIDWQIELCGGCGEIKPVRIWHGRIQCAECIDKIQSAIATRYTRY